MRNLLETAVLAFFFAVLLVLYSFVEIVS